MNESVRPKNMTSWFKSCINLESIIFTIPDSVTNMNSTFEECIKLSNLPENFTIPSKFSDGYKIFYVYTRLPMMLSKNHPMTSTYNFLRSLGQNSATY